MNIRELETINMDGVEDLLKKALIIKEFTVEVRPEHTVGTNFTDVHNCALCKALREQYPEFIFKSVSPRYVTTPSGKWDISSPWRGTDSYPFGYDSYLRVAKGESVTLTIRKRE